MSAQASTPTVFVMTRRTPVLALLAATTILLAACAHASGDATSHRNPASAGLGANPAGQSPAADVNQNPGDIQNSPPGPGSGDGTGGGNGNGTGGGHASPSPSKSTQTGPRIVSFSATGAQCQRDPTPDAPYSQPGKVDLSWQLANAQGVSLSIDGGSYKSYEGASGSDTIYFACPAKLGQTNTHHYTLTILNTSVTKSASASAKSNQ
jgi:hypothetical protein